MTSAERPLRKWQVAAFEKWKNNGRRGIVEVVTGGGKTVFALHCLKEYRRNVPAATVLIVVPTEALLDQWVEEIISFFGIPFSGVAILSARRKIALSRINIGVINTVAQVAEKHDSLPLFLVVDECHKAASPVFRKIFALPTEATLGLSATPERQYDDGLNEILIPNLGPVIFNYTYKEAMVDKVIVPFSLHNVVFDFDPEEQKTYTRLTNGIQASIKKNGMESPLTIALLLKRARLSNSSPTRVTVTLRIVAQNRSKKILVFHEDVAACEMIHKALTHFGVSSGIYHSQMSLKLRVETLAAFRAGETQVLVSCRALDEGFNVPETEVGIIAASTATHRQRVQRLGRVLRPSSGKDRAAIYSIVAAPGEIRRLADEATNLEGLAEVTWSKA